MAIFQVITVIAAPPETCFDLARDMSFHVQSLAHTGEKIVAGVDAGLIELGQIVTFRGRHLGWTQEMTAQMTRFDRPRHFQDQMIQGRFAHFVHDHYFELHNGGTQMRDVIDFASPWGLIGRCVDALLMKKYLCRLISGRGTQIKIEAEHRQRDLLS